MILGFYLDIITYRHRLCHSLSFNPSGSLIFVYLFSQTVEQVADELKVALFEDGLQRQQARGEGRLVAEAALPVRGRVGGQQAAQRVNVESHLRLFLYHSLFQFRTLRLLVYLFVALFSKAWLSLLYVNQG